MKLEQHFQQHLSSDVDYAKGQITRSILNDESALDQLDEEKEVWLQIDMGAVGKLLDAIRDYENKTPSDDEIKRAADVRALALLRETLSKQVERLWAGEIDDDIDSRYDSIDLEALRAAENHPEPGDAA